MAETVLRCLQTKKNLLIEAGTGVGKSFAYLIPVIISQEKTVVSTSSLALQDQLVKKDLVFLRRHLPLLFTFGVLKGKNNYLCCKREKDYNGSGKLYERFRTWLSKTITGDKADLSFIPDFWFEVCGDPQDCNGKQCPFYHRCFYYLHYNQLFSKDILVVNHHLLVHDILSDCNILPFHRQLIVDEAPDIENVISDVFGSSLTYTRMTWLLYRLRSLKIIVDHLFSDIDLFFKKSLIPQQPVFPIPSEITERLKKLRNNLSLENTIQTLEKQKKTAIDDELKDKIETTMRYVKSFDADLNDFIEQNDSNRIYFAEGNNNSLELKSSLVETGNIFQILTDHYDTTVLTSATMTSGGNFTFLKSRLSLEGYEESIIGSPFDYHNQALLYIEKSLPKPDFKNEEAFHKQSLHAMESLINASEGRALVLFTSFKQLYYTFEYITLPHPYKMQGDMPTAKLIKWFKETPNSVLLATATFWQGIDIKGDDLSLVIIARLPFSSPGDPVYSERCRRLGDRWFSDLALPSAVLSLRQGFGRLIRGQNDFGVVAILDTRIVKNFYGKTIISSLPETIITHDISEVKRFFETISKAQKKSG